MTTPLKIIAFDPGVTTGWCRHIVEPRVRPPDEVIPEVGLRAWDGGQFSPVDDQINVVNAGSAAKRDQGHHLRLYNFLQHERPDVVICERFVYEIRRNQGNDMPGIVLMSRDYIGVIELYCKQRRTPLLMQTRNPLSMWKDDKLKKLGLHTPGAPHRNDATRHLLDWVVTKRGLGRTDYLKPLKPASPS